MKHTNLLLLITAVLFLLAGTSCSRRKGCTNINAENYDQDATKDDGSCKCRYASALSVDVIPATDGAGNAWDPFSAPDLYVRFAKASSSAWDYKTSVDDEAVTPSSLILPNGEVKFTNENWQFEILDEDTPDADDVIYSGTFNPISSGGTGNIIVTGNGVSLTFRYTTKNE
jgi:hypothetical protein